MMESRKHGRTFLRLEEEWCSRERSRAVILPIPYEYTTSYGKGTEQAPEAIIKASHYLELYDEELDIEIFRLTNGIATLPPMILDEASSGHAAVETIRNQVRGLLEQGKTVVSIGGEHTMAIGAAQAHTDFYPPLSILQLDAHSDLRDEYEGSKYSHACVMARMYEFNKDIVQAGIRSQCAEEAAFIGKNRINTFYAFAIREGKFGTGQDWFDTIIDCLHEHVYLTFDCDFFDPSVIPSLGTPEPGGFGWDETIAFLRRLAARRTIVGFDVNELMPIYPLMYPQFTIAKLIYKLIGYIFKKDRRLKDEG